MSVDQHLERKATVKWVPINLMKVSPLAQREFKQYRVDRIIKNFDPERLGVPTVNKRDGEVYIVDGQHRVQAVREMGWEDQQLQCTVYDGLTEEQEADLFLALNDILPVSSMDKYKVGVVARRKSEVDIDRVVRSLGLKVTLDKTEGAIRAVGTLQRVYDRSGVAVLKRTLNLTVESYGDSGLQAAVIDGIAFVIQRYGDSIDDGWFAQRLGGARAGVSGLLSTAEVIRKQTSASKGHAVAAAVVQTYNGGSNRNGVKKLPNWWKEEA